VVLAFPVPGAAHTNPLSWVGWKARANGELGIDSFGPSSYPAFSPPETPQDPQRPGLGSPVGQLASRAPAPFSWCSACHTPCLALSPHPSEYLARPSKPSQGNCWIDTTIYLAALAQLRAEDGCAGRISLSSKLGGRNSSFEGGQAQAWSETRPLTLFPLTLSKGESSMHSQARPARPGDCLLGAETAYAWPPNEERY
jgi:hypothetical protein